MNPGPSGDERDTGDAADAPLHEALDDLEHMLGPGGIPAAGSKAAPAGRETHGVSHAQGATEPESAAQETLHLALPAGTEGSESWDPALYRMAAQRLASELEIIMNARLEAALARLGEDLRRELQNHIEIVLPEIVSNLAADDIPPGYE